MARPMSATATATAALPGRTRSTTRIAAAVRMPADERADRDEVLPAQWAAPRLGRERPRPASWSRTQAMRARTSTTRSARSPADDRRRDGDRRRRRRPRASVVADRRRRRGRGAGPGWRPKTTTSAPSGTRVRISTGVMSVRWSPRPGQEVGHLAEHDPAVHVQQVAGGEDHHEGRDRGRAGSTSNVPSRTRNSPTNPDSPGSPAEANTKNPNTAA